MSRPCGYRVAVPLLGVALLLTGCRSLLLSLWRPAQVPGCAAMLVPSGSLPDGLRMRHRHRVEGDGVAASLETVAETRDGRLALVGMNAFGSQLFGLVQRDREVEVVSSLDPALRVPPGNVLRDLHLAWFFALPEVPRPDGVHRGRVAGAEVVERWQGGTLRERTVRAAAGAEARVRFAPAREGGGVEVRDPECGYRATLVRVAE